MLQSNSHIIQKIDFDIQYWQEENAFSFQEDFVHFFYDRIHPLLNEQFDRICKTEKFLRIPKLTIDLETLDGKHWQDDLIVKLRREISQIPFTNKENLSPSIFSNGLRDGQNLANQGQGRHFKNEQFHEDYKEESSNNLDDQIEERSLESLHTELLFFYLIKGYFPWSFREQELGILEKDTLSYLEESPFFLNEVYRVLKYSPPVLYRLDCQCSISFAIKLLRNCIPLANSHFANALLFAFDRLPNDAKPNEKNFLIFLFQHAHQNVPELNQVKLLSSFLSEISQKEYANLPNLILQWEIWWRAIAEVLHQGVSGDNSELSFEFLKHFSSHIEQVKSKGKESAIQDVLHKLMYDKTKKNVSIPKEMNMSPSKAIKFIKPMQNPVPESSKILRIEAFDLNTQQNEEIYIHNAGLILLYPFLPLFFEKIGLTQKENFLNFNSQLKAICLLEYLATGTHNFYEYKMALNKILCGVSIQTPIPVADIKLGHEERSEGEVLLLSMIKHWPAIKGTNIEALREEFLRRSAKLFLRNNGWNLVVEKKATDILIDRLPWSISIVKLPWINHFISTYWN